MNLLVVSRWVCRFITRTRFIDIFKRSQLLSVTTLQCTVFIGDGKKKNRTQTRRLNRHPDIPDHLFNGHSFLAFLFRRKPYWRGEPIKNSASNNKLIIIVRVVYYGSVSGPRAGKIISGSGKAVQVDYDKRLSTARDERILRVF